MSFAKVYQALINKAERKGRTEDEVNELSSWLLGYSPSQIQGLKESDLSYGDFFRQAPNPNPKAQLIDGSICGIKIQEIKDPLMRQVRVLDKLVDDLAKGKSIEKITLK